MRITWNGDGNVHTCSNESPAVTWDSLSPATENLHGQGNGVDIGAVVGNDRECKHYEAEFAKGTKWWEKNSCEKPTRAGSIVSLLVYVVTAVDRSSRHDSNTEHFSEKKGDNEPEPCSEEDLLAALGGLLIDGVVSGVRSPASSETIDNGSKGQN